MDDLPFSLWLGMIPTVRVKSKGSGGCGPSPCDSVGVSAALSPPYLVQEFQQEGCDLQVQPEDSGRCGPQVDAIVFPIAFSFPPGSCESCPPPGYWVLNSSSLLLQISIQSHLWLPLYPSPIPHRQMALKKGEPRRGLPSSFFLKMSAFLLLPDPVLNH